VNVTSAGAQSGRAELSQFRPVVERDEPLRQAIAAGAAAAARPSVEAEQDAQLRPSLELLGTPRMPQRPRWPSRPGGVRKFDPPRNRRPREPCGRYLARAPLGSSRHINKERNQGQRTPSRPSADRLGRPIDPAQRLSLRTKRESRSLSSGNFEADRIYAPTRSTPTAKGS